MQTKKSSVYKSSKWSYPKLLIRRKKAEHIRPKALNLKKNAEKTNELTQRDALENVSLALKCWIELWASGNT